MAWLTYSICSHSAERCLFKDMVCLENKQRRKHEPGLCLVMVKCKMKWNKTTSFDPPQELNPQLWIHSMSFKCSRKTTANSCLCMKVSFDIWALTVWEECPQSTRGCARGPWRQSESLPSSLFFRGRDELLRPWHALGLFCPFQIKSWGVRLSFSTVREHGWTLQR